MTDPLCPKCRVRLAPGIVMLQTWTWLPDFPGDTHPVTLSPGGPGRIGRCLKCPESGHSIMISESPK